MPLNPRPGGLQPRVDATNPLSRGLVFAWAPGFPLRDFVGNRVITRGASVGVEGNGKLGRYVRSNGFATATYYLVDCPVSSGDVSFLSLSQVYQNAANSQATPFGAINTLIAEHLLHTDNNAYLGPFGSSRYVAGVAHTEPVTLPHVYSGSIASGVTNGAKVWINNKLLGSYTVTTSFPTQIGLGGQSSAGNPSPDLYANLYLFLVWNRALSDNEMASARNDPWQVLAKAPSASRLIPMFSTAAPPPPPPGSYWGGYQTIQRPNGNVGLRVRS